MKAQYLFSFIIIGVGLVAAQTTESFLRRCSTSKCIEQLKKAPHCDTTEAMTCLNNLKATCEEGKNETNMLYKLSIGLEIAEDIACKNHDILSSYKNNPQCWFPATQCALFIGYKEKATKQFCYQRRLVLDLCKEMEYLNEECKELHRKFVDLMYDAIGCHSFKF